MQLSEIVAAVKSPLSALAFLVAVIAFIAWKFFGKESIKIKVPIFVVIVIVAVGFSIALLLMNPAINKPTVKADSDGTESGFKQELGVSAIKHSSSSSTVNMGSVTQTQSNSQVQSNR